jgi:hypothetical protein
MKLLTTEINLGFLRAATGIALNTVEPGCNERTAFQRLYLTPRDFESYRNGEHSSIISCLINNG